MQVFNIQICFKNMRFFKPFYIQREQTFAHLENYKNVYKQNKYLKFSLRHAKRENME